MKTRLPCLVFSINMKPFCESVHQLSVRPEPLQIDFHPVDSAVGKRVSANVFRCDVCYSFLQQPVPSLAVSLSRPPVHEICIHIHDNGYIVHSCYLPIYRALQHVGRNYSVSRGVEELHLPPVVNACSAGRVRIQNIHRPSLQAIETVAFSVSSTFMWCKFPL